MFNHFKLNNDKDFIYLLDTIGDDVLINNNPARAIITNAENDDKYISTLGEIKQGDRIQYNGLYWLVISAVNGKNYEKYKGVIRVCNHIIGFKIDDNPVCIPVIAYGSAIGVTSDKFITIPKDEIILTIQANEVSKLIALNDRFVKWGKGYKVEGIDSAEAGLLNLHCSRTPIEEGDTEYTCTLAGDVTDSDWYIVISGEIEVEPDNSYSYTAKVYNGEDEEQDYSNIVWSLNAGANSTIDENGVLNIHADDTEITIYATLEGTSISGELELEIQGEEISYSISGADEIINGYSANYTAQKLVNGSPDPSAVFNFSIDYQGNSSNVATLTVISNTECKVDANSAVHYIRLIAEDADTLETVDKEIRLRNLF